MQHAGSFKARGAFANLLTRADSGVRRGRRLWRQSWRGGGLRGEVCNFGIAAKIFVPTVASPEKIARI